jgi:hypothetical protein
LETHAIKQCDSHDLGIFDRERQEITAFSSSVQEEAPWILLVEEEELAFGLPEEPLEASLDAPFAREGACDCVRGLALLEVSAAAFCFFAVADDDDDCCPPDKTPMKSNYHTQAGKERTWKRPKSKTSWHMHKNARL